MTEENKLIECPITGDKNTEFINSYDKSITSDSRIIHANVENRISKKFGLLFNATGSRFNLKKFYTDDYNLHDENTLSEFMVYKDSQSKGIYGQILEFIDSEIKLSNVGNVLEIGCGKGILLKRFSTKYPDWNLSAVEPSKNAKSYLKKTLPELNVFNGTFEDSPYINQKFDLVLANGILEHVPDLNNFLKLFKKCLGTNGIGYIGVPNFSSNPSDLFTYDHLSRFTPLTLEALFCNLGFTVIAKYFSEKRVPMWYLIKATNKSKILHNSYYEESKAIVENSLNFISKTFKLYDECVLDAKKNSGKIGMYGTGAIGILGSIYSNLNHNKLDAIFDDNSTIWKSKKLGVFVSDPSKIMNSEITHMVISANPCYIPEIKSKIKKYGDSRIKIYA